MRIITVAIVLSALSAIASHAQAIPDDDGFVPLFDGTTLDGWDGDFEIWTAQDGKIVGKSDGLSENVYLVTANRFQDFELRLDVLVVDGEGNSGVQFRSERLPDSKQVSGYQADIGEVLWGSLYDEARRDRILSCPDPEGVNRLNRELNVQMEIEDPTPAPDLLAFQSSLKADGWNDYIIRAEGDQITLTVNGYTTATYRETESEYVKPGIIGLQVHSGGPMEVQFRNLRIKELASSE